MLPISFLRQLIRFYGDSMQALVPRYLEISLDQLSKEQGRLREQMAQAFGLPFEMMEEQVRKNLNAVSEAMTMFTPFAPNAQRDEGDKTGNGGTSDEIAELKEQLATMQSQLDKISKRNGKD